MAARQIFDAEYEALSQEKIAALKHQAEEEQQNKNKKVPKQVKRAQQHSVTRAANGFQQAVSAMLFMIQGANVSKLDALHCQTGHYGVCILIRGDKSMDSTPVFVTTGTGNLGEFFEDYTNKPLLGMLEDLDAWCTNGLRGIYFILFSSQLHSANLYRSCTREKECTRM